MTYLHTMWFTLMIYLYSMWFIINTAIYWMIDLYTMSFITAIHVLIYFYTMSLVNIIPGISSDVSDISTATSTQLFD